MKKWGVMVTGRMQCIFKLPRDIILFSAKFLFHRQINGYVA